MPRLTMEARLRRMLSRSLRPLQASARRVLLRTTDSVLLLRAASADPKRVLLVRLDNIGDFVVWLDAARALVQHFHSAGAHVTLLGSASWAGFASDLALFDEVIALDQQRFKHQLGYRRHLLARIRSIGFGTVIQPTMNRVPEMGDAVVRISGAKERVGVIVRPVETRQAETGPCKGAVYTRLILVEPEAGGEMQANAALVRALTGTDYGARIADLQPAVNRECLGALANLIPGSPYVVLFPGASAAGRQWPEQHFATLARRCVVEYDCPVLICGGPGDLAIAEGAANAAGPRVVSLAGKTSLKQLATVIAGAQLLVSNETSAVHIAAAVGVPSVCIVGGGHFGRFLPYNVPEEESRPLPLVASRSMECFGCNWVCKFHPAKGKPMPCIEEVSVDTVWQMTASVLNARSQELEACL